MEWLVSLAPVLGPLFGALGVLGGAWMVHRQSKRKNDTDEKTSESQIFASAVTTVTTGFTGLLEQSRATNAETLKRMATLEGRHLELERKVEVLQEVRTEVVPEVDQDKGDLGQWEEEYRSHQSPHQKRPSASQNWGMGMDDRWG